ncbi:MAG: type III pantothenate kinase [Bacteroidetes bacterium]|nr:type III pantothenate kinase [Bacteroidota bacterium]
MLLAIDVGNTNVVLAVKDGAGTLKMWRMETDVSASSDEYCRRIQDCLGDSAAQIDDAVVASVVPDATPLICGALKIMCGHDPLTVGAAGVDLGIRVNIDQPEQAGADRLADAVGAQVHYDLPAIILDFGTATTLDLVAADGSYEGGIIAPGVALSIETLAQAAAQLPRLELRDFSEDLPVLGKNTVSAMESGVFWGYVSMIEGLLMRLRQEHGDVPAIATGGLASLFAQHLTGLAAVDPYLTVQGLFEIYARNRGEGRANQNGC